MHAPDNIRQWSQCIQVTVNPKTFVLFISACTVSVHLGFPDVWRLAKATPPPGLLDIWKFQTSGKSWGEKENLYKTPDIFVQLIKKP